MGGQVEMIQREDGYVFKCSPRARSVQMLGNERLTNAVLHVVMDKVDAEIAAGIKCTASLVATVTDYVTGAQIYVEREGEEDVVEVDLESLITPVPFNRTLVPRAPKAVATRYKCDLKLAPLGYASALYLQVSVTVVKRMSHSQLQREAAAIANMFIETARHVAFNHAERYGRDAWLEQHPPQLLIMVHPVEADRAGSNPFGVEVGESCALAFMHAACPTLPYLMLPTALRMAETILCAVRRGTPNGPREALVTPEAVGHIKLGVGRAAALTKTTVDEVGGALTAEFAKTVDGVKRVPPIDALGAEGLAKVTALLGEMGLVLEQDETVEVARGPMEGVSEALRELKETAAEEGIPLEIDPKIEAAAALDEKPAQPGLESTCFVSTPGGPGLGAALCDAMDAMRADPTFDPDAPMTPETTGRLVQLMKAAGATGVTAPTTREAIEAADVQAAAGKALAAEVARARALNPEAASRAAAATVASLDPTAAPEGWTPIEWANSLTKEQLHHVMANNPKFAQFFGEQVGNGKAVVDPSARWKACRAQAEAEAEAASSSAAPASVRPEWTSDAKGSYFSVGGAAPGDEGATCYRVTLTNGEQHDMWFAKDVAPPDCEGATRVTVESPSLGRVQGAFKPAREPKLVTKETLGEKLGELAHSTVANLSARSKVITNQLSKLAMSDAPDKLARMKAMLQGHVESARAEGDPHAEQLATMLSTQINQADVSEWAPPSKTLAVLGVPDQPTRFCPEGATEAHYVSEIPLRLRIDLLRAMGEPELYAEAVGIAGMLMSTTRFVVAAFNDATRLPGETVATDALRMIFTTHPVGADGDAHADVGAWTLDLAATCGLVTAAQQLPDCGMLALPTALKLAREVCEVARGHALPHFGVRLAEHATNEAVRQAANGMSIQPYEATHWASEGVTVKWIHDRMGGFLTPELVRELTRCNIAWNVASDLNAVVNLARVGSSMGACADKLRPRMTMCASAMIMTRGKHDPGYATCWPYLWCEQLLHIATFVKGDADDPNVSLYPLTNACDRQWLWFTIRVTPCQSSAHTYCWETDADLLIWRDEVIRRLDARVRGFASKPNNKSRALIAVQADDWQSGWPNVTANLGGYEGVDLACTVVLNAVPPSSGLREHGEPYPFIGHLIINDDDLRKARETMMRVAAQLIDWPLNGVSVRDFVRNASDIELCNACCAVARQYPGGSHSNCTRPARVLRGARSPHPADREFEEEVRQMRFETAFDWDAERPGSSSPPAADGRAALWRGTRGKGLRLRLRLRPAVQAGVQHHGRAAGWPQEGAGQDARRHAQVARRVRRRARARRVGQAAARGGHDARRPDVQGRRLRERDERRPGDPRGARARGQARVGQDDGQAQAARADGLDQAHGQRGEPRARDQRRGARRPRCGRGRSHRQPRGAQP